MKQEIWHGDCLELMKNIPDKSVDAIICDLPYGTTACKWDVIIPFDKLWEQYERIIIDKGPIILFSSQPFTTFLIKSKINLFKYELIWDKQWGSNFQLSKIQPLKRHENILVFGVGRIKYNPQKTKRLKNKDYTNSSYSAAKNGMHFNSKNENIAKIVRTDKFPDSIISIGAQSKECNNVNRIHPTQKPVELLEYLIKTYTNEGDIILDNCAGSGSTGVAAKNQNRQFILIEKEKEYYDICLKRLAGEI